MGDHNAVWPSSLIKPETGRFLAGCGHGPADGGTYQAKLWLDARGNLNFPGLIGIPQPGST